ncbi:hypothetical protein Pan153_08880 [Gimesia panareensis]|uniref:Uncharacterized protein n=1 Tax=Gimesia panareensis TaxID=2527978 RepID=A0A518FIT6_9PLAN|nr:hypothetical protein [Gimesia panareensis]QDV16261.1 hypothetical protein Pan153_08880 [Gimesia panareensis]
MSVQKFKLENKTVIVWKIILSSVILGMMVNDGHYDLPVITHSGSLQDAQAAAGHYHAVAGGNSLIFEYIVPVFIVSLVVLQGIVLNRCRNRLAAFQTLMYVIGFGVFGAVVAPHLRALAAGTLAGDQLLEAAWIAAIGHAGLILLIIASIWIDRRLETTMLANS